MLIGKKVLDCRFLIRDATRSRSAKNQACRTSSARRRPKYRYAGVDGGVVEQAIGSVNALAEPDAWVVDAEADAKHRGGLVYVLD